MSSLFGSLWRAAYPRLEEAFGEALTLQPMMPAGDINGRPGADPDRLTIYFTGIFDAEPQRQSLEARGKSGEWALPVVSSQPEVDAPVASFATSPRVGDRITRAGGTDAFVIAEVRKSDLGRYTLLLNRV